MPLLDMIREQIQKVRAERRRRLELRRSFKISLWKEKRSIVPLNSRKLTRRLAGKGSARDKFEALQELDLAALPELRLPEGFELHKGEDPNGLWQLEFLRARGLKPEHEVLDVGCGDLREGVPLTRFLDPGNYVGVDLTLEAVLQGLKSFEEGETEAARPSFFVGGDFGMEVIGREFDWAWAHSVFTHVNLSMVGKCMASVFEVLKPGGRFIASFFDFASPADWTKPRIYRERHDFGPGVDSSKCLYSYRNPFQHARAVLVTMAETIGYQPVKISETANTKGQIFIDMTKPGGEPA